MREADRKKNSYEVKTVKYLAFDLGASSGKMMLGEFDGSRLKVSQIHKFLNHPINMGRSVYWDYLYIYSEMIKGIQMAANVAPEFVSMGIDGYCNDFSFINAAGDLLFPIRSYRDNRTGRYAEQIKNKMKEERLFSLTGNLSSEAGTRMQLAAMSEEGQEYLFEKCDKMLFLPDLLLYYLTGEKIAEFTLSSVSQLMNYRTKTWDAEILDTFLIPNRMMGEIVKPGTLVGKKSASVYGLETIRAFDMMAVCEHDTASAFSPYLSTQHEAVISSGTWMLCGVPINGPLTTSGALERKINNEGNLDENYFLVKSIMGTWLIQEVLRECEAKGMYLDFVQVDSMILEAKPFRYSFEVDDRALFRPGNMMEKIKMNCMELSGAKPESLGDLFRCIQECLAFKCRQALEELQEETGKEIHRIHIIDGGAKDKTFCKFLANVCNMPVNAGSNCASALGNIVVQMIGRGEIESMKEGYTIIQNSFIPTVYYPDNHSLWNEKYLQYRKRIRNRKKDEDML